MRIKTFKKFNEQSDNSCEVDLNIVAIDETASYNDAIKSKIGTDGKIYAYYLFDASKQVYLAEITPSYDLNWLYNRVVTSNELSEDELSDIELTNDGEANIYIHVNSSIFTSKKSVSYGSESDIIDACSDDEEYDKYIDAAIDSFRGNV